jgi:hypothetical protein
MPVHPKRLGSLRAETAARDIAPTAKVQGVTVPARRLLVLVVVAALLAAFGLPAAARATTLFVTTTATDPGPANGQGACAGGGACSLRQAVNTAPTIVDLSGAPTVISLPAATLARDGTLGPVQVTSPLTIAGQGAQATTIIGSGDPSPSGALSITGPVGGTPTAVTLRDLTIFGGVAGVASPRGGGVSVLRGALTVSRVAIHDNHARANASATASGGGIDVQNGSLDMRDSALSGNDATGVVHANNSAGALGGGIGLTTSTATITNSTVAGNTVDATTGAAGGGGINVLGGTVALDGVTVARNTAKGGANNTQGGNISALSNAVSARASIVANGVAPAQANCFASVASQGGNVEDLHECGMTASTDRSGTDPQLAPLQANGGPTETMAIPAGSPAVDLATSCDLTADQRGVPRPQGAACDSGAFEAPASPPTTSPPTTGTGTGSSTGGSSTGSSGGTAGGASGGAGQLAGGPQLVPSCALAPAGDARALRVVLRCDQAVSATLQTAVAITRPPAPRRARATRRRTTVRRLTLPATTVQVPAATNTTVTVKLPSSVAAATKLRGGRVALAFTAVAVGANGATAQAGATISRLKPGKKPHKRRR